MRKKANPRPEGEIVILRIAEGFMLDGIQPHPESNENGNMIGLTGTSRLIRRRNQFNRDLPRRNWLVLEYDLGHGLPESEWKELAGKGDSLTYTGRINRKALRSIEEQRKHHSGSVRRQYIDW